MRIFMMLVICLLDWGVPGCVLAAMPGQELDYVGDELRWQEEIINPDVPCPLEESTAVDQPVGLALQLQRQASQKDNQTVDASHERLTAQEGRGDGSGGVRSISSTPAQQKSFSVHAQSWIIPTKSLDNTTEVALAATVSKKGKNSIIGWQLHEGYMLLFNKLSKNRQNNGLVFRLYFQDDQSDMLLAKKNVLELHNQSPLIVGLLGDKIVQELIPIMHKKSLIGVFPVHGSVKIRSSVARNFIYFRPTYAQEIRVLIQYAYKRLKKRSFGIFFEESPWGRAVKEEFVRELTLYGVTEIIEGSYPEDTVNVSGALRSLGDKAPSLIFCVAHARPASVFIRQALNQGLYNTTFVGLSELAGIQDALKELRGVEFITSSVVPDPASDKREISAWFRDDMKKYMPERLLSHFAFEGYMNALLLYEICKTIKPPLTTAKVVKAFERIKDKDFHGLPLSFDEKTRTLSSSVWINQGINCPSISAEELDRDE